MTLANRMLPLSQPWLCGLCRLVIVFLLMSFIPVFLVFIVVVVVLISFMIVIFIGNAFVNGLGGGSSLKPGQTLTLYLP